MEKSSKKCSSRQKLLHNRLNKAKTEQWLANNATSIQIYNEVIKEHGMFSDEYRKF